MRVIIPVMALGLGLVGLSGCADPYSADTYNASAYRNTAFRPTTTTTTTFVRDANGNPLSTAETVRDANGNPVNFVAPGTYQSGPGYYQYVPGTSPQPYRHY
jgi:hypothetical protein